MLILGGFLYVVSPFDIIPEVVFGIVGLIDDLSVVFVVLFMVAQTFRGALLQRNN